MTIRFQCKQCKMIYWIRDELAEQKGECSCGAILDVPSVKLFSVKTVRTTSRINSIPESFLAISIGLIAIILALSFIFGAILTRPDREIITQDKEIIAAQLEQIEQDVSHVNYEIEQFKKHIETLSKKPG